jgi:hypothetical protein
LILFSVGHAKNSACLGLDATGYYLGGDPIGSGIPVNADAGPKMAKPFN